MFFGKNKNAAISIHALLAESDWQAGAQRLQTVRFLSTLSLRRATQSVDMYKISKQISIHALLAESDYLCPYHGQLFAISIHALLAESDCVIAVGVGVAATFLSTLSLRRAT